MNKIESKLEYDELLKSGMFWEFYPNLTGNWNTDKLQWGNIYLELCKYREESKI